MISRHTYMNEISLEKLPREKLWNKYLNAAFEEMCMVNSLVKKTHVNLFPVMYI